MILHSIISDDEIEILKVSYIILKPIFDRLETIPNKHQARLECFYSHDRTTPTRPTAIVITIAQADEDIDQVYDLWCSIPGDYIEIGVQGKESDYYDPKRWPTVTYSLHDEGSINKAEEHFRSMIVGFYTELDLLDRIESEGGSYEPPE